MVEATVPGLIVYKIALGTIVEKGDVLGHIVSPIDGTRTAIVSKTNGLYFARRLRRLARPGQVICKVSGSEVLRTGKLLTS